MKKIKEVMSRNVIKIEADKHVSDAARLMAEKGVGCVIVTSGSKTIGIITEKDLVRKVLAKSLEMTKVSVIDVMSTPLFTISSEQMLDQAAELMVEYKVRRLPVVDDGILVGIITANDLARTLANEVRGEELTLKAIARIGRVVESSPMLKKGLYIKRTLEQIFSKEIVFFRRFVSRYPFLSIATSLFIGLLTAVILSFRYSQYVLLSLVGGFPISIVYGTSVGVPAELSCAFVIFLDCFVIFASLKFSYYLSDYPRLVPHLAALRNRYRDQINLLSKYINKFHMVPTLAVINFLIGPWISMILAYGLQINVVSTIKGAAIGLFGAATVSLALYKGLITTIPDPLLVTVISLVILFVSTTILKRSLKSRL